jgi:hypothetical protein
MKCMYCNGENHSSSKCPVLWEPLKDGFYSGQAHQDDENQENGFKKSKRMDAIPRTTEMQYSFQMSDENAAFFEKSRDQIQYSFQMSEENADFFEKRRYQRQYYETPIQVAGMQFDCVMDYAAYQQAKNMEEARLQNMTSELKLIVRQMALDQQIEEIAAQVQQFETCVIAE